MLLRGFKTQCFCAILELEKIFEDLKNLFSKGLYLSTTGQENELCQISLQKDEKLERFFSETDPNLVNVSIYHMPLRFSEKKKKKFFFHILYNVMENFILHLTCRVNGSHKLILESVMQPSWNEDYLGYKKKSSKSILGFFLSSAQVS